MSQYAKVLGFKLLPSYSVTLDALMAYFNQFHSGFKYRGKDCFLFTHDEGDFYSGLVITKMSSAPIPLVEETNGDFKSILYQFEKGRSQAQFNYFTVQKATGSGLYIHYSYSRSINDFYNLCRHLDSQIREQNQQTELSQLESDPYFAQQLKKQQEEIRKEIRTKYRKGHLNTIDLMTQETWEKVIKDGAQLREVVFMSPKPASRNNPISAFASSQTVRYGIIWDKAPGNVVQVVMDHFRNLKATKGRALIRRPDSEYNEPFDILDRGSIFKQIPFEELIPNFVFSNRKSLLAFHSRDAVRQLLDFARTPKVRRVLEAK